jgi:hypothetical protein
LLKQFFNLIGVLADELSQGGEVRDGIAGQRLENDVGLAAPLDLAAGGDALRVRKQNNLQQNGRIVGQSASVVVAVLGMKHRQIQLVFDQIVNRVLEGARLELLLVIDDHHRILIVVVVLETRHADDSLSICSILANSSGDFGVFLKPQR